MPPFFSIGVTTYRRLDFLKEALASILQQKFGDYEVIVGNDYIQEPVSPEMLGLASDPRIRFVNNPRNLGEMENCNALLSMCRGRYFTWLADDDLHAPAMLQTVHESLTAKNFPPCLFTSYAQGKSFDDRLETCDVAAEVMTGRTFLHKYLSHSIKVIGCYGFFETNLIRRFGGMTSLGAGGLSPYSDNLLAIKAGLLEKVLFIDAPLVFWRVHENCRSATTTDLNTYMAAQIDFLTRSAEILRAHTLHTAFRRNLRRLMVWCIKDFWTVAWRSGKPQLCESANFAAHMMRFGKLLVHPPEALTGK